LTALAFALWPLGRAHDIPVGALFRDNVAPQPAWPRRVYVIATAVAVICLAALGFVAGLGRVYLLGVAVVAALLVYEQSLVREDDLSQVKRAFDLNGYVGILYLLVLAASIYGR